GKRTIVSGCRVRGQEGVGRWRLGRLHAGSALSALPSVACVPESGVQAPPAGRQLDAMATSVGATGRMQAAGASTSPQQLAAPYAYEDHGQQMFALERGHASAVKDDPWPAPVRMSRSAAERARTTGSMEVGLPDGTRYPVVFERIRQGPRGNMTWIGRVASPAGDLAAVLTYGRNGVFGVLPTPEGRILQIKTRHGQAYLEPDPGLIPPGVDPEAPFPDYVLPTPGTPNMLAAVPTRTLPQAAGGAPVPGMAAPRFHDQHAPAMVTGMAPAADGALIEVTVLGVYTTNL